MEAAVYWWRLCQTLPSLVLRFFSGATYQRACINAINTEKLLKRLDMVPGGRADGARSACLDRGPSIVGLGFGEGARGGDLEARSCHTGRPSSYATDKHDCGGIEGVEVGGGARFNALIEE